jgi:hypothetical protein
MYEVKVLTEQDFFSDPSRHTNGDAMRAHLLTFEVHITFILFFLFLMRSFWKLWFLANLYHMWQFSWLSLQGSRLSYAEQDSLKRFREFCGAW